MSHGPTDEPPRDRVAGGGRDEPRGDRPRRDEPGSRHPSGPSPATYAGLGFQFVGAILLFLYVGRWADSRLGTAPWLLIVGVFVGAGAGFYSLYRKLMQEQAREDARRAADRAGRARP